MSIYDIRDIRRDAIELAYLLNQPQHAEFRQKIISAEGAWGTIPLESLSYPQIARLENGHSSNTWIGVLTEARQLLLWQDNEGGAE